MSADLTSRRFMGDLRREYDDSMATLRPLLARIDETDRLIDLVVYRLYGLSSSEVEIVDKGLGG
ncbi:MAG: hypothetical protein U9N48_01560 [Euryarchaeota archaeon]|nr:hypothetical protein [Euryarchaeota archaeon]